MQNTSNVLDSDAVAALTGISQKVAQKLKAAGLSFVVKDERHKIAKLSKVEALKGAYRFKAEVTGAEEPVGVTVIELLDATKRDDIKTQIELQWKMVEQISPGKYNNQYILANEHNAIVIMVSRKNDHLAAENVRNAVEK